MNNINQFTFFRNYWDVIKELPNKEEFIIAILEFVFEDKKPNFNGLNKGVWSLVERPLQISKNKSNNAKSNKNQKEIKLKSNENQIKIKKKSNKNQSHYSISSSISNSISISNINNINKINKLLEEYLEIRIKNKYVVNETVVKRLINKLNEYGLTDTEKIEIIENAINGKWKDFYPLKEHKPEWFNKELKNKEMTEEDQKEMDKLLNEIIGE